MGVYMASKTLNMNDLFLFSFNLLIFIGEEDLRSALTWIVKNVPISDIVSLTVTLRTSNYGTFILLRYHKIRFQAYFSPDGPLVDRLKVQKVTLRATKVLIHFKNWTFKTFFFKSCHERISLDGNHSNDSTIVMCKINILSVSWCSNVGSFVLKWLFDITYMIYINYII